MLTQCIREGSFSGGAGGSVCHSKQQSVASTGPRGFEEEASPGTASLFCSAWKCVK